MALGADGAMTKGRHSGMHNSYNARRQASLLCYSLSNVVGQQTDFCLLLTELHSSQVSRLISQKPGALKRQGKMW
jgi:hypothetical protein